ncbi:MAG TPA: hypothetical protein VFF73_31880, partial [Planctomycetota bacterium]|nr:hypothetical protein [Planctomycetota bacterium]
MELDVDSIAVVLGVPGEHVDERRRLLGRSTRELGGGREDLDGSDAGLPLRVRDRAEQIAGRPGLESASL